MCFFCVPRSLDLVGRCSLQVVEESMSPTTGVGDSDLQGGLDESDGETARPTSSETWSIAVITADVEQGSYYVSFCVPFCCHHIIIYIAYYFMWLSLCHVSLFMHQMRV